MLDSVLLTVNKLLYTAITCRLNEGFSDFPKATHWAREELKGAVFYQSRKKLVISLVIFGGTETWCQPPVG